MVQGNDPGDKVRGNWDRFRMKVREQWNDLTDDDIDRSAGRDRLLGRISERTRLDRNAVDRDLGRIERDAGWDWNR